MSVPVDLVESLNVFKTPYVAQYGRFTAGLVSVETRRGGDKWSFDLSDPVPEFRIRGGTIKGVRGFTPRLNFSGPLMANRLHLSEGLEYRLNKRPVRTLGFPVNETKEEAKNIC
jgi:outer membrane receptor for ferrienterochelin and colicin